MISGTITDQSGRTLTGQTAEAFWYSMTHARPLVDRPQLRARREGPAPPRRRTLARVADVLRQRAPERRPAERVRRLRRDARDDGGACSREFAESGLREHRRRLLRHDARRTSARSPRRCADLRAARASRGRAAAAPVRARAARRRAGHELRQHRRAHQRHRLDAVREADPRRRLRPRRSSSRASRSRAARSSSTSTWTRACSTPSRR